MRLLLDTQLLLRAAGMPETLSPLARNVIEDPANELFFSAASLWEIAVKRSLGRPDFQVDPRILRRGLIENEYRELAITGDHALAVDSLPLIHKDPFDRMLLAQGLVEEMVLLTSDEVVAGYPGHVLLV